MSQHTQDHGQFGRWGVSAGSKLVAAREKIAELQARIGLLEIEIRARDRDQAPPARSLLRRILPFVRHQVGCPRDCECGLEELRGEILTELAS